ncbi:hypothetical protein BU26DRAFT_159722 [Trematosphaeria pertusa]|uniref:Uncharacterized protein n=1 Tax=Trematosphaeria pertusa TaxID=390896 RepID=A0A6A6HW05_9PLEO|nr:uncharacterized protein BU26DRAFT_159722 [Trematosphaeria pertusa]KAF2242374.1 hypothetical protein BU26DRAFT_159722 [Trematosphaeria pertusa]
MMVPITVESERLYRTQRIFAPRSAVSRGSGAIVDSCHSRTYWRARGRVESEVLRTLCTEELGKGLSFDRKSRSRSSRVIFRKAKGGRVAAVLDSEPDYAMGTSGVVYVCSVNRSSIARWGVLFFIKSGRYPPTPFPHEACIPVRDASGARDVKGGLRSSVRSLYVDSEVITRRRAYVFLEVCRQHSRGAEGRGCISLWLWE